mmetsp:Transcript_15629/g.26971  ORF Transcript_15629/g.26971 Transcript_15629/m.26971 type:complete len:271 (-) Transcript_15629:96-908(-)
MTEQGKLLHWLWERGGWISPAIEQYVCCRGHDRLRPGLRDVRVVEVVPAAVVLVHAEGCVVSATEAAKMVRYGEEVVDAIVRLAGRFDQVRGHVQSLNRELNKSVDLVTRVRRVREALQVHDEDLGQAPEGELLAGLLVRFALRAVPLVPGPKHLSRREQPEARVEGQPLRVLVRRLLHRRVRKALLRPLLVVRPTVELLVPVKTQAVLMLQRHRRGGLLGRPHRVLARREAAVHVRYAHVDERGRGDRQRRGGAVGGPKKRRGPGAGGR